MLNMDEFRAFAAKSISARTVDSYVSNLRTVMRLTGTGPDDWGDESAIKRIAATLPMSVARARDCASAMNKARRFLESQRGVRTKPLTGRVSMKTIPEIMTEVHRMADLGADALPVVDVPATLANLRETMERARLAKDYMATFHMLALRWDGHLPGIDAAAFCRAVGAPASYATEYRKMAALKVRQRQFNTAKRD